MLTLFALGFSSPTPIIAAQLEQNPIVYSTTTAPVVLEAFALKYGIDPEPFIAVARCESRFRNVQSGIPSATGPNGREDSWGVFQIHLPAHPKIARAQALDPLWNIDWAARQFRDGNQHWWTCYRNMYGHLAVK